MYKTLTVQAADWDYTRVSTRSDRRWTCDGASAADPVAGCDRNGSVGDAAAATGGGRTRPPVSRPRT